MDLLPNKVYTDYEIYNFFLQAFDRLRSELPGVLESKVEIVEGDVKELRLGLSNEDYQLLQEKVEIIFHVAASVRFNDPLPDATLINLRGTHEVVLLALGMHKLKVIKLIFTQSFALRSCKDLPFVHHCFQSILS